MFEQETLAEDELKQLTELSRLAKGDIIKMTTLAGSGHPGGAMSSLDMYLVLFSYTRLKCLPRDRIVISHGHTSAGVYAALARLGYMPVDEAIAFFRKGGSPFEGHVVRGIPFIDWSTGNLGQGLSAGCGFALAAKVKKENSHIYVVMGDGEQQKGQLAEARRFATKYGLSDITALIDYNRLQISGSINTVMPQNIVENYLSDGWDVIEINGHDYVEIYNALKQAGKNKNPTCILANTVMGNGVPFMENKERYHGNPLNMEEYKEAMRLLEIEDDLESLRERRKGMWTWKPESAVNIPDVDTGTPFIYGKDDKLDNRSAFGKALKDIGEKNIAQGRPVCALDCDLSGSVKTIDFEKAFSDYFFQGGIQEHNTATVAGAISTTGILTFFAAFGVFGIDETYNQERLNDINRTNLKVVLTHLGLDVGQDGKTHQCTDYIGLVNNLHNFRAIIPCDANQTDRAVRYVAGNHGNYLVGTGRSRWPIILDDEGKVLYGEGYTFVYGRMDTVRSGDNGVIIAYGGMVGRAMAIRQRLLEKGIRIAVVNMPCVQEIDSECLDGYLGVPYIITYEDHNRRTGIAPLIAQYLLKKGFRGKMESFGVTSYGVSGDAEEALANEGLDVDSMVEALSRIMG